MGIRWTEAEIAVIRSMTALGHGNGAILARLPGRTYNSLAVKKNHLGLKIGSAPSNSHIGGAYIRRGNLSDALNEKDWSWVNAEAANRDCTVADVLAGLVRAARSTSA